jgi:hypothetical protein
MERKSVHGDCIFPMPRRCGVPGNINKFSGLERRFLRLSAADKVVASRAADVRNEALLKLLHITFHRFIHAT